MLFFILSMPTTNIRHLARHEIDAKLQDIAVDGWALTMLRKENVGYAATTNAMGQTLGYAART